MYEHLDGNWRLFEGVSVNTPLPARPHHVGLTYMSFMLKCLVSPFPVNCLAH